MEGENFGAALSLQCLFNGSNSRVVIVVVGCCCCGLLFGVVVGCCLVFGCRCCGLLLWVCCYGLLLFVVVGCSCLLLLCNWFVVLIDGVSERAGTLQTFCFCFFGSLTKTPPPKTDSFLSAQPATYVSSTEVQCRSPAVFANEDVVMVTLAVGGQAYGAGGGVPLSFYACSLGLLSCADCVDVGALCGWCGVTGTETGSCLAAGQDCVADWFDVCPGGPGGSGDAASGAGASTDVAATQGISTPVLIGAIAGGAVAVVAVIVLVVCCACGRRKKFGDELAGGGGSGRRPTDEDVTVVASQAGGMGGRVRALLNQVVHAVPWVGC